MIRKTGIDYVCTGHCTGVWAFGILKEELGEKINLMSAGFIIEL